MNIQELIEVLKHFNPKAQVIISNEALTGEDDEIEIWVDSFVLPKEAKVVYLSPDKRKLVAGDIVSRDGSDRHEVIIGEDGFGQIRVRCIKAPEMPWAKINDVEDNLARRYQLIEEQLLKQLSELM